MAGGSQLEASGAPSTCTTLTFTSTLESAGAAVSGTAFPTFRDVPFPADAAPAVADPTRAVIPYLSTLPLSALLAPFSQPPCRARLDFHTKRLNCGLAGFNQP